MRDEHYYKDYLDAFGETVQLDFAIEEMSELTKAICKYKRKDEHTTKEQAEKIRADIVEEIADVKVCLEELIYIFDCMDEVTKVEDYKFARGQERIKQHYLNLRTDKKD